LVGGVVRDSSKSQEIPVRWLSGAAYAGMFGFGIVMALLGAVLPILAQRLHFDLRRAGELFLVMNAGMLVTTLALGPALDRFGQKAALLVAPLFVAGALGCVTKVNTFSGLMMAVLLLGIGGAGLNQATNTLVADLCRDAHTKSANLNILGVFFGFGALFVPFTIGSALRQLGLGPILYLAMALSLLPVALSAPFPFPPPRQRQGVSATEMLRLLRQSLVLVFAFLLFFESGNEFILGGYITTYLTADLHVSIPIASDLLAVYWASLMLGRILLSRAALRIHGGTLIRASAAGVVISMILLLASHSIASASISTVLLGLSTATIFPTALGIAGSRYASHSGTVFGILMTIALCGGMTMPWLLGRLAENWDVRRALSLVVLNAFSIFCLQFAADRIHIQS
jgi:MFS transporter, FHS family, glucose/mannose:H+ symporter